MGHIEVDLEIDIRRSTLALLQHRLFEKGKHRISALEGEANSSRSGRWSTDDATRSDSRISIRDKLVSPKPIPREM